MPRVHHVKKARKDNPVCKKGESYYWWQFAFSSKSYSLTYPKPSQLTRSAYYQALYSITEDSEGRTFDDVSDLESFRDEVHSSLEELRDEMEEKIQNMSEHGLEYTPTGELVQERLDALEAAASTVECIDMPDEFDADDEDADEDEFQEKLDEVKSEIVDAVGEAHV